MTDVLDAQPADEPEHMLTVEEILHDQHGEEPAPVTQTGEENHAALDADAETAPADPEGGQDVAAPLDDAELDAAAGAGVDGDVEVGVADVAEPVVDDNVVRSAADVFADEEEAEVFQLPRLDELLLRSLAENFAQFPAFDRIPAEYVEPVVAMIDPNAIEFHAACKFINSEVFWRRLSEERWPVCQPSEHGLSWKRLYAERHLEELILAFHPSRSDITMATVVRDATAAKPYVFRLRLPEMLERIDLNELLGDFPNLFELEVSYACRSLGMDYSPAQFGLRRADLESLRELIARTPSIACLSLRENLIDLDILNALEDGLARNHTITEIDVSHNRINDEGVYLLCSTMSNQGVCSTLVLNNNAIGPEGAKYVGDLVRRSKVLRRLSLGMNEIGDEGAQYIITSLLRNPDSEITELDLSCTGMTSDSTPLVCKLLESSGKLTTLRLGGNHLLGVDQEDEAVVEALERSNGCISDLDLRRNGAEPELLQRVKKIVLARRAESKRERRKQLFAYRGD